MKKIISILLVLAMCAALFAGCTPAEQTETTGATEGTNVLANAKEYIYTIYKADDGAETAIDYNVISVVSIGTGTYAITWTVEVVSGDGSCIEVVPGDTTTTIKVAKNYTEAPVVYNLVATVADEQGNSESVTFAHTVPVSAQVAEIADGTYVIAAGGISFAALDASYSYGYVYGNAVTESDYSALDVVTITNVDGGVTIQDAYGRYVYLKGTYTSFNVDTTMPEEGHIWEIQPNGDGYKIVNVSNQKTMAYSSSYTSWGAYDELTDDHNSLVTITAATAGDVTVPDVEDPTEDTTPVETPDNGSESATVENGITIYLYNAANEAYATGTDYIYTSSSTGNQKHELELTSDKSAALALTVQVDGEYVTFVTADGKYLYADGTNVQLVDEQGDHTKFVLETAEGGYYLKCANATYNDKPQYLEIYSGYLTVYGFNASNTGIYTFELIGA